jgi:hypothetical protein
MDIQFIQFSDTLPVTGAREIPDIFPRSIQISGADFSSAKEILINEVTSPSFIIVNKRMIIAQIPDAQKSSIIESLSVLSSDFTATFQSRIRFCIGNDPKKVTGLKVLMQTFLKILFTTSGIDIFSRDIGGSALKNIGKSFNVSQSQTIISDLAMSVRRAEMQMKEIQNRQSRLLDDERLLAANLLNSQFDPQLTALITRVELIAQSGTRAIANLEL